MVQVDFVVPFECHHLAAVAITLSYSRFTRLLS